MMDLHTVESFFQTGGLVPDVDPSELERVFYVFGGATSSPREKAIGFDVAQLEAQLGPEADPLPLWYRSAMLGMLFGPFGSGQLSHWLHDGKVDPVVFRVAASFPIEKMQIGQIRDRLPLDVDEFFKSVEAEAGK